MDLTARWHDALTIKAGRRRKKSCIPRQEAPNICEECFARGTQCQNQESAPIAKTPPESKQNLQQRVAELETALQIIVRKLGDNPSTEKQHNGAAEILKNVRSDTLPPTPSSSYAPSPDAHFENAPLLSLFDNAILSRHQDSGDSSAATHTMPPNMEKQTVAPSKMDDIRRTLLSLFPSHQKLEVILDASKLWWPSMQAMFPQIFGPGECTDVSQFISESRSSGSVQRIAKALLCIANCLQEAPMSVDPNQREASTRAQDLGAQYLNTVDDLVLSKDELVGTLDGVECMFLQAKNAINGGQVRKAWITFRRAISLAQLLGLHLRSKNVEHADHELLRRESLWKVLWQGDRFLSLILGLPYSVPDIGLDKEGGNGVLSVDMKRPPDQRVYPLRLAAIIGHIIDRNQESSSTNTLSSTIKIEGELMDLAASVPSEWWKPEFDQESSSTLYNRLLPQFWHHQARTLLHLPFMLKAATDRRYEYNRIAALESARDMIGCYRMIRPAQGFGSLICKVIDFQVFTAAMILVLNLLAHKAQLGSAHDHEETDKDWDLVFITTEILQRAALETDNGVATQAARALETFGRAKQQVCPSGCSMKMVIPYFGSVIVGPGKSFVDHEISVQSSNDSHLPAQVPTPAPSDQQLDTFVQDPSTFDNYLAPMPSEFSFDGFNSMDGNVFANVNMNLDQDWSWFWNNTEFSALPNDAI
ncbi:hypothetical protein MMC28_004140 [Mycoblastus sanguinarius]|nr:hypothetical protein [Mycoblastus sanguinarius]